MSIDEILNMARVIPVIELSSLDHAAPLAAALAAGGVRVVELTLRTDCALSAVAEMKKAAPTMRIGMGTLRKAGDVTACLEAGAEFLVSPGANLALLEAFAASGAPALPGVASASEAMTACALGFTTLKFFPAEAAGGVAYLKALAGPLPDIKFCATGGISAEKAVYYLALSNVASVGGSWIATKRMISAEAWDEITENAGLAMAV